MFKLEEHKIFLLNKPVDMRKSFNGLQGLIVNEMKQNPRGLALFVFFNKRRNYLKVLFWDRTGYCLISKKLESSSFSLLNRGELEELTFDKLRLIFDGIKLGIK